MTLGRDLFFEDPARNVDVARYALETPPPEEDSAQSPDDDWERRRLEEAVFEVDLACADDVDLASAFSAATAPAPAPAPGGAPPPEGAPAPPKTDRLARFVRAACERGALGGLCALPWSKEDRRAVDDVLNRLARKEDDDDAVMTTTTQEKNDNRDKAPVDYYGCLYAFRASCGAWDEAARAALEVAARADHAQQRLSPAFGGGGLGGGASDIDEAARRRATVALGAQVAALNALHLLSADDAFVAARSPVLAASSGRPTTELQLTSRDDLEEAVCLRSARLQLAALAGDARDDSVPSSARPRDVASSLARRGAHERALDLVNARGGFDAAPDDAISLVFASLAKRCVDLDDDDPRGGGGGGGGEYDDLPPDVDRSPFSFGDDDDDDDDDFFHEQHRQQDAASANAADVSAPPGTHALEQQRRRKSRGLKRTPKRKASTAFSPRSRRSWLALRRLVEGCDSRLSNFACAKAAAQTVLAAGRELPRWLADRFTRSGAFATGDSGDPAALLRLYVRYDQLPAALTVAADLIDNHKVGTLNWLPYSHLEALLRATKMPTTPDDPVAHARTRLVTSLRRYAADLAHATLLEKAAKVF